MEAVAIDKAPKPLLTQIQAAFRRDPSANRIALVWPDPLSHGCYQGDLEGQSVQMKYCVSELAMREALVEGAGDARLVLVSPFDVIQLARDVLARLWRNEPQRISPWKTLEELTQVQSIDPRLPKKNGKWMAEALLSCYDRYASKVQFGEVLDNETAWRALALGYLNYGAANVDLPGLFEWSLAGAKGSSTDIPKEVKANLLDWLQPALGEVAAVLVPLMLADAVDELLAIGLACSVLYSDEAAAKELVPVHAVYTARGKFSERQLAGANVKNQLLFQFGQDAEKYVSKRLAEGSAGYTAIKSVLSKAEQLLASVDVLPIAESSDVLPASFRLRLQRFAKELDKAISKNSASVAHDALLNLRRHVLSALPAQQEQIERAQMAVRLVQWLEVLPAANTIASADQGFVAYLDHGGFVDWARTKIWAGDADESLSQVYQRLVDKISASREAQNHAITPHLDVIARGDKLNGRLLYVEQVLESLLAPIAEKNPVLLLVLDGMSQAVFCELVDDLVQHGWVELRPEAQIQSRCLVSALPSITKVSRCSLLSGALSQGLAVDEKAAFTGHPTLKRIASTKAPPALFHKQELQQPGSGALNSKVREAIASTESRILAAVINAIDDQLSSSSQIALDWRVDSMRILWQVLEAAREAGRVVIITSDHGHVLDHDSFYLDAQSSSGERYHLGTGTVRDQEILLKGPRVVTEHQAAVLPWSEKVRYSKTRSMGYHGGASLQELVIPLGIFVSAGEENVLPEWREVPVSKPAWWSIEKGAAALVLKEEEAVTYKPATQKQATAARMDDLFAAPKEKAEKKDWIENLFKSPVYEDMRSRVGRLPITEEELGALLNLLARNAGHLMQSVVVRELNKPELRMRGFLSAAQRLLNVDGYPILQVNRESQTITLDIRALKTQFDL